MNANCYATNTTRDVSVGTEKIKVLKVVGQAVGQLVLANSTCINAVKIDRIKAKLLDTTNHLFKNKVVVQGTIRKEIFYVDPEGTVRYKQEDLPFMLSVDIPGLRPSGFSEIQNHLLDIDVDYRLTPSRHCIPGCLEQKIVAHILVVAAEWTQMDVVTRVNYYKSKVPSSRVLYTNIYW
ncbi:MAG: DUF3794 domain-containing protein [Firmicutes bacterium]|nr:DUF3794 domain-containing protein [Bacillota bacterium]